MKNKKAIIIGLITSSIINALFIWTGIKTMNKYGDNPGNWHFIAALVGTIVFAFLLIVLLVGFYSVLFPDKFPKMHLHRFKGIKLNNSSLK